MDDHDKADLIMKILIAIMAGFYFWLLFDETALAETDHEKFCKTYMVWVEKYPNQLSIGCCDINHPSNDIMKEGWKGQTLLVCGGVEIA